MLLSLIPDRVVSNISVFSRREQMCPQIGQRQSSAQAQPLSKHSCCSQPSSSEEKPEEDGDTHVQPRELRSIHVQCNQVLKSEVRLRHSASFAHFCPCPVLSLALDTLSSTPPMFAHLPTSLPGTPTWPRAQPLCILMVCPHIFSLSLCCCPVPANHNHSSLWGIKPWSQSAPRHQIPKVVPSVKGEVL